MESCARDIQTVGHFESPRALELATRARSARSARARERAKRVWCFDFGFIIHYGYGFIYIVRCCSYILHRVCVSSPHGEVLPQKWAVIFWFQEKFKGVLWLICQDVGIIAFVDKYVYFLLKMGVFHCLLMLMIELA